MGPHPSQIKKRGSTRRIATAPQALASLNKVLPHGVREVLQTLEANGARAVLVGGIVRDAFMGVLDGKHQADWDVASDAPPHAVASWFPRVVRSGEKHGTIMVLTDSGPVEVTTFRGEGAYLDGRRPSEVFFHQDVEADLARRDFTINAMAADMRRQEIIDPYNGQEDLRRGLLRCVGDPVQRFTEDGLRPLRAVRFAAVLGLRLDKNTRAALAPALPIFLKVAWERRREEMTRLLARASQVKNAMRLLKDSGMLQELAPEVGRSTATQWNIMEHAYLRPPVDPWLRLTALLARVGCEPSAGAELAKRWRASRHQAEQLENWLSALKSLPPRPPKDRALRQWLAKYDDATSMGAARLAGVLKSSYKLFQNRVGATLEQKPCLRIADLAVSGADLLSLGISGPAVGRTLTKLLDDVLETPEKNTKEKLLHEARKLSTSEQHP